MTQQPQQLPAETASRNDPGHVPVWHSSFYRFEQLMVPVGAWAAALICALPVLAAAARNTASAPQAGDVPRMIDVGLTVVERASIRDGR
jgi:hypothetical protein